MVTPGQLARRAALFEQLAATIAAGLPLTKAIEMAARNRSLGIPRKTIQDILGHMNEGHTFTDAMRLAAGEKRPGMDVSLRDQNLWLPEFDASLLSAGEEAGRLDATFRLLARYYESRARIIRDTISGLIVTMLTLHVFLIIFPLFLLVPFVLGLLNGRYQDCLPFIIEKTIVFGALWGSIFFLIWATQGNRAEGVRIMVENVFMLIPGLRNAIKYLAVARLAMALDALLNSGVHIVRAWELAAVSSGSPTLKRAILKWAPEMESGTTPSEIVCQIRYFPEMFQQLYQSGELAGKTDETLTRLHTYYEEEGFRKLRGFSRAVSIGIYLIVVLSVAGFILNFWMNYYGNLFNGNL